MSNSSRVHSPLPALAAFLLALMAGSTSLHAYGSDPHRGHRGESEEQRERDEARHRQKRSKVADPKAEAEPLAKPTDQPEGALAHFLKRRQPVTTREQGRGLDYSLYAAAMEHSKLMPLVSSARPGRPGQGDPNAPDATNAVPWTAIGPGNIGGRTLSWVFDPTTPSTMYTGTAGGGVWKTTNGGTTWTPVGDLLANLAIASLAIAPGGTTLYAGTGEGAFNVDGIRGAGIFKSTDSGATWSQLTSTANSNFYYVNDIVISPNSASTLYAATRTGVWRSLDAGVTWTQFVETTGHVGGCFDLVVKPATSPDTVFAACGSFYSASFSKPTAAVYRNTNANGAGTFVSVLSNTGMARTSLAIAPSATNTIYAVAACSSPASGFTCNFEDGLRAVYRSTDGGGTWTTQYDAQSSTTNVASLLLSNIRQKNCLGGSTYGQGWYDNVVAVDPTNANVLWVGGIDLSRSDDAGVSWGVMSYWWIGTSFFPYAHADHHFIAYHPNYNGTTETRFYNGNDGGVTVTSNPNATKGTTATDICPSTSAQLKGATFASLNNGYQVTQYYDGTVYPDGSTYFGGAQDNGTTKGTTAGGPATWTSILGGDGGYVAVDSSNTNIQYGEFTNISIYKSTNGGANFAASTSGISDARGGQFINPFTIDPNTPANLWTSGAQLWRTTNNATSWTAASTTTMLTHNSACAVSASPSEQFTSHAVAVGNSNRVLAGTDCGYIFRNTAALSATSATVWASAQPATGYVDAIAFDPSNELIAYAVYGTFGVGHIWKTTDGGATWSNISGAGGTALPDAPAHSVAVDPDNGSKIFVGTDIGVYVTTDGGANWARENTGFANVSTERLLIRKAGAVKEIYAFTHGRSAWKADISNLLATSTTTVASSANPSVFSQSVTFTATVSGASGTPTGNVTFFDGASSLGTSVLSGGSAALAINGLAVGSHNITASYGGNATYGSSTSTTLVQVVNPAATTTSIASDTPDPSVTGQSVTVSASVAGNSPATLAPSSGTINVTAPTSGGCSIVLPATSCAMSFTAAGATTITATFAATTSYATSNTTTGHTVNKADTSTGLGLSTSTSVFGQSVTLTATVAATAPGSGTPTGTVTFFDGATNLGTGTLSSGVATLSTSALAIGAHSLTATYGADTNFNGSTSSAQTLTVSKASTTTGLGLSSSTSVFGQSVTLTATVAAVAPGSGTPTGTVTFFDGATNLGTGTLSAGVATLSTSALAIGAHSLTATYGADTNFNGSTSSAQTLTVGKAGTGTALGVAPSSSSFGQTVTLTATVTATAPGSGTPTGTVTFFDGATNIGSGTLNGAGVATMTKSNFTVGTHASLTAVFGGDGNFNGSTSSAQSLTVGQASSSTALGVSPSSSTFGQTVTLTATVTSAGGTPTGTVTFFDGATNIGTGTLNGSGVASMTKSNFTLGTHASLTAAFGGDTNFSGSTSPAQSLTVNQAGSTTTLGIAPSSSTFGQSVTFTATVVATSGTATGTVTFKEGVATLGTGTLNGSGIATFSTSSLAVGSHSITASYGGDANVLGSTSGAQTATVALASSSTALTLSASSVTVGSSVTLTATVGGSVGTPIGTVTFFDGGTTLGTGSLNGAGVATLSTSALTVGNHSLTASYGGSAVYAVSTSTAKSLDVTGGVDLSVTIGNVLSYLIAGSTVTYTLDVANAGPLGATNALLSNGVATGLTAMTWTCATLSGATCPNASGSGAISEFVTLGAGQSLRYTITATVSAAAGDTVNNSVGIEANSGDFELDAANNSSTDSDPVRGVPMFSDGFE